MNSTSLRFQQVAFKSGAELQPLIEIASDEVHVWGCSLDVDRADLTAAMYYLSGDELKRADRLVSERHRQQFIAAHAALRVVLSCCCGRHPQELVFHTTSAGKPFLTGETMIRFNLTHSHGRALIAIARDREVGIDLEKIRPEVNVVSLAKRFLSGQDQAFIEAGGPEQRHERFLQVWVAREAVFKAEGTGMTFPLHRDHVEVSSDGTEGRLISGACVPEGANMPVRFLPLESGWVGAVAAEGTNWTVTYRSLRGS